MKVSLNWLKDYISFDFSAEELSDRLTMLGLEVEDFNNIGSSISGIVVGDVLEVKQHPNADKLHICTVDVGDETLSLVCGAPNVTKGQRVPVAKLNAVLADRTKIKEVKLRGVVSAGMICSERELGISDDHSGILVLDKTKYSKGDIFNGHSKEDDTVFEINVTPNRPDCLSHIGVAREVGVLTKGELQKPKISIQEVAAPTSDFISVEIQDADACPRYSARVVQNITIDSSPDWLKSRLEAVGIRSINNVVDITNFVLMETGHPLHAFDYDFIKSRKIIVRKATDGEHFTSLDDKDHTLSKDDLLICDDEKGVALAGVMGGQNSEVTEQTRNILLESAYFDPMTIRKTAKNLGRFTEASQRFERGADPNNTIFAVDRAAQLLADIAGGTVLSGIVDACPKKIEPWHVSLRMSRIKTILGKEIDPEYVIRVLCALGLDVDGGDPLDVTVPTFRPDLTREIDLIEEIIRHYGYEKIDPKHDSTISLHIDRNREDEIMESIRDVMVGMGFFEIVSNSLVSEKHVSVFQNIPVVRVRNPLSPDTEYLRNSLLPGLLDTVRWNINRSSETLRVFEIGRTFHATGEKKQPKETYDLIGAMSGHIRPRTYWGEKDADVNFYDLKGFVQSFLERLHISEACFQSVKSDILGENECLAICQSDQQIGMLGKVEKQLLKRWDIETNVYIFEFSIDALVAAIQIGNIKFVPISRFPAVHRDLAVVIDQDIEVGEIQKLIRKTAGKILTEINVFDLYRGKQIADGKKSVAFSLTFMSNERTLKETDVDPVIESILKAVKSSYSASLRSV